MMLRFILNCLNPYKNGIPRKKRNLLQLVQEWVYRLFMSFMLRFYKRYAYCDTIQLGSVKVRQSCRDIEFEKWLLQLKTDIRPHLKKARKTDIRTTSRSQSFRSFFRMECITIIEKGKDKVVINRTNGFSLITEVQGELQISDVQDIMSRSEFRMESKVSEHSRKIQISVKKKEEKVSLGNTRPIIVPTPKPEIEPSAPSVKQLRGAEVDESF